MAMPRYAVLQSCHTNKFVDYIQDDDHSYKGYVCMKGESVLSPRAKLEFEKSQTGKDRYHIRSCHYNKYWVRSSSEHGAPIVAKAKEPNEDKLNKENCTLFKVEVVKDDPEKIYMWHEGSGELVIVNELSEKTTSGSLSGVQTEDASAFADFCYFNKFDWDLLVFLPRHVAFKGPNGLYLQVKPIDGLPYLQFSSTDSKHPSSQHEIFPNPDGTVRIKSKATDKFWRSASEEWICADETEDSSNIASFKPIKVEPKTFALKMLGKEHFCSRLSTDDGDWVSRLNANTRNSLTEAKMEIEELVIRARIDNVHFRLDDAKISEQKDVVVSSEAEVVHIGDQEKTATLSISFAGRIMKSFSTSFSVSASAETTIGTGIPFIMKGEIKFTLGVGLSFVWGTEEENTHQVALSVPVKVPPKTKVCGRMLATKGRAEIPFSYIRRVILLDGTDIPVEMDDGVFTTTNYNHLRIEPKLPEKIISDDITADQPAL